MTHSLQPTLKLKTPEGKLEDFGLDSVTASLTNSLVLSGVDPFLEADNPRVLRCADSVNGDICRKAQIVLSTEGFSLGLTSVDQNKVLLNNPWHRQYHYTFLKKNLSM